MSARCLSRSRAVCAPSPAPPVARSTSRSAAAASTGRRSAKAESAARSLAWAKFKLWLGEKVKQPLRYFTYKLLRDRLKMTCLSPDLVSRGVQEIAALSKLSC